MKQKRIAEEQSGADLGLFAPHRGGAAGIRKTGQLCLPGPSIGRSGNFK